MAVTWTLFNNLGQVGSALTGSPLALEFNDEGYVHKPGDATLLTLVDAVADTATVTIELTPDAKATDEEAALDESESRPSPDTGYTWTDGANGLVTLVFDVPPVGGPNYYEWVFGNQPPIALKMTVRVRR